MLAGCLVALKQIQPDSGVTVFGYIKFRAKVRWAMCMTPVGFCGNDIAACELIRSFLMNLHIRLALCSICLFSSAALHPPPA